MSTIKIEFESEDNAVVSAVAAMANSLLGKKVNDLAVVAPVELNAKSRFTAQDEAPAKTPTPRASRAKAKPEPTPEPEEEEIEEEIETEEEETPEIDADDIRAVQATKVDKHRETIKAQLKKLGATGIKDLDEAHYAKYYEFLSKLK